MSKVRGGTRIRASRKPVVVLAGEDSNDRKCLRIILEKFCPEIDGRLVEINTTIRLHKASQSTLADRVAAIARTARARAARENAELGCVFVHEDLDGLAVDKYTDARLRVQKALTREFDTAHYVLAVEEIEAWLLLFPEALTGLVSSWKVPKQYQGRDTARLADPKGILKTRVSTPARRYRESDAPEVFDKAVALGCINKPTGTNLSWSQLGSDAIECCQQHINQQRKPQ